MDQHPFRIAFETRDLKDWVDELAEDVVAFSPMLSAPFRGRELLADLYRTLFETFDEFEITEEFVSDGSAAFFWQGVMKGRRVQGTDLLRRNQQGKISEITVFIRPLIAIADFGAAVGPPFARRRGRVTPVIARLVSAPLRALFAFTDAVAARIVLGPSARRGR